MLHEGDNLQILSKLPTGSVDLIYLDPPFFSQRTHRLSSKGAKQKFEFEDTWESIGAYISFLELRLIEMRRVLKDTGSIFLHCDKAASHHIRVLLDKVFGIENFQSEIIWSYKRWSNSKKGLLNNHQNIYFYSKSSDFKFIPTFEAYSATTNIDQIFQKRERNADGKAAYKQSASGDPELMKEKKGVPLSDVWSIPFLNPKAKERTGYPTQKPILLLERIIELTTEPGDMVLDPFCGSGTTLIAAKLLGRSYLGIDKSSDAITLTQARLDAPVKTRSALMEKGVNSYRSKSGLERSRMEMLDIQPVERNKGIDGFAKVGGQIRPIPVLFQKANESLPTAVGKIVRASAKNKFRMGVVIGTENSDVEIREYDSLTIATCGVSDYAEAVKSLDSLLKAIPKDLQSDVEIIAKEPKCDVTLF
ncbi:DNA-methyltransferase [Rhodococcus sp. NPDC078407]|uniref:DNA-methyltransferase n=1 Tax=Rhodococcus sp. NPDC078407 TaxID=3364509 RepID=UPI0037C8011A